jgi:hypothetical protein
VTDEAENRLLLTDAFWRLAQRVFPRVMTDVVYWVNDNDSPRIAFVGDPLKVALMFGLLDGEGLSDPELPRRIGRAIQSEMSVPLTPRDMFEMWERGPAGFGDLLDRLGGKAAWQWSEAHDAPIGDEGVRVGFIPEPGYPWPTEGGRYWSAKRRRWLPSEEPGWLIEVESRDAPDSGTRTEPGVNPCLVFPPDETKTQKGGPVCGDLDGSPLMVTHAMSLLDEQREGVVWSHKQLDTAIAGIKDCGGLLFPSLAVGQIPATNFGPVVLVAHLELVLDSLLPYRRGKRRRPCWVYGTDAWTKTTGNLMRDMAMELFEEFHGDDHWNSNPQYWATLGVPASTHGGAFSDSRWHDPLKSTKQLASSLRKRLRGWTPDMTIEEFSEKNKVATPDTKYAYTEAKAREVVRLDEFPFIVAPSFLRSQVERFAKGVGYKGKVVYVREEPWMKDAMALHTETRNYALYVWAWQVAEIVEGLRPVVRVQT